MKTKHIFLILLLFCTSFGFAQNKLFDKYAEMDNVTSVYISKAMFQMMPSLETGGLNLVNMVGKIDGLQILTTKQADVREKMKKDFGSQISNQHVELMRVKDGKTRTVFYIKQKDDIVNELIVLADTDAEYSVIQLTGNFTLKDIRSIANSTATTTTKHKSFEERNRRRILEMQLEDDDRRLR